jgi:NAD(P)-dependent dehydrogenase (short-subunit alcohol dehydrogenase family)
MSTGDRGKVVVTGASTGIGEATAKRLRELGFEVLAGVRRDEDAERVRDQGLTPLRLDVTDAGQIAAMKAEIGTRPLAGLVNNAGVAAPGPVEYLPIDRLRDLIEVNLIGQVAVTQALIPALRAGRGRIVNISSIGGLLALPLMSSYHASKFALEGVSDSLRRELRGQGIDVIVIEPGGVKTPIWGKGDDDVDKLLAQAPPEAERLYGPTAAAMRRAVDKIATETGEEPRAVAEVIGRALTTRRPRTRYLVGRDAKGRALVSRVLPDRVMDRLIGRALGG